MAIQYQPINDEDLIELVSGQRRNYFIGGLTFKRLTWSIMISEDGEWLLRARSNDKWYLHKIGTGMPHDRMNQIVHSLPNTLSNP